MQEKVKAELLHRSMLSKNKNKCSCQCHKMEKQIMDKLQVLHKAIETKNNKIIQLELFISKLSEMASKTNSRELITQIQASDAKQQQACVRKSKLKQIVKNIKQKSARSSLQIDQMSQKCTTQNNSYQLDNQKHKKSHFQNPKKSDNSLSNNKQNKISVDRSITFNEIQSSIFDKNTYQKAKVQGRNQKNIDFFRKFQKQRSNAYNLDESSHMSLLQYEQPSINTLIESQPCIEGLVKQFHYFNPRFISKDTKYQTVNALADLSLQNFLVQRKKLKNIQQRAQ